MSKLIAVPEDDPRRCQSIDQTYGQCRFQAVENATCCPRHKGDSQAAKVELHKVRNYRLQKFQDRVHQLTDSPDIKSLREEIGMVRLILEEIWNKCESVNDLLLYQNKIQALVQQINKLIESCHRLEERTGQLLDKPQILLVCDSLVKIIADHVVDPNALDTIATEFLTIVAKVGGLHDE